MYDTAARSDLIRSASVLDPSRVSQPSGDSVFSRRLFHQAYALSVVPAKEQLEYAPSQFFKLVCT